MNTSPKKSLKCGYLVGIDENTNELVFEVVGKDTGLIELLGCHEFARHKVGTVRDIVEDEGTPYLKKALSALGKLCEINLKLIEGLYRALNQPLPADFKKD